MPCGRGPRIGARSPDRAHAHPPSITAPPWFFDLKIVIFGLTVSSSWGNGHATLWRGLIRALLADGHQVMFFERDVPYYAEHRDLHALPRRRAGALRDWDDVRRRAGARAGGRRRRDGHVLLPGRRRGDARLVLDGRTALRVLLRPRHARDAVAARSAARRSDYIGPDGLGGFDLVLSYTGGAALDGAARRGSAPRRVAPLYGHVDPAVHRPGRAVRASGRDLSYLGTYAADRQAALEALFVEPARRRPERRFVIGGRAVPGGLPLDRNIYFVRHLPPAEHPAFFSSVAPHAERHARGDGRDGLVPVGAAVRGRRLRRADPDRRWEGSTPSSSPAARSSSRATRPTTRSRRSSSATPNSRASPGAARERVLAEHTADAARPREMVAALEDARSGAAAAAESLAHVGHHSGRRAAAAASSRSPSPRSCCRSAAGSMTAGSSGPAPSANTWSSAWCRAAPTRSAS